MAERLAADPGTERISPAPATPAPEPVLDLHADIRELLGRLSEAGERGEVLDAYLYACGIVQLIEDWSYGTDWRARQLVALLGTDRRAGRLSRRCVNAVTALRRNLPGGRRALRVHALALEVAAYLASEVLSGGADPSPSRIERLARRGRGRLPASLRGQVLRPPSSFRSFDQHPQDMVALAQRFARLHPDRDVPLLVLGVRTSGGYLAALTAAALSGLGYRRCDFASTRNGEPLPGARLRRTRARQGIVLVVDDPPSSGSALATTAGAVRAFGFAPEKVVPVFAGFGSGTAPPALAGFPCVVLPAADWHIRTLLGEASLRSRVQAAFPDRDLVDLRAEEPGIPTRDAHLAVRLSADLRDASGEIERIELVAEGAGQGYLGRHAVAVAAHLPGWVPRVYAFDDGVILREAGAGQADAPAETVVGYAAARQRRLPLERDRSAALQGRQPVWEIGGRLLSRGFGRLGMLARPLLIDPPLRRMLMSPSPCIVDGRTALFSWVRPTSPGPQPIKTDFDDGCFSHLDLAVYDAAYDLAGAAVRGSAGGGADARELLEGFERACGRSVDPATWCVYQLVQAWNLDRVDGGATAGGARAVQEFLGRLFLDDLRDEPDGPWCVLDVDGVLELDFGGMPVSTFAAMRALRALRAHGFRVLLATGRSGPDVRDRCAAYRLAGGAAEYGSMLYDASTGTLAETAPQDPRRPALIEELSALASVRLDPDYRYCVRASAVRAGSRRGRGLDEAAARCVAASHPSFTQVQGHAQTDFLPEGTDKARGVRQLLERLGGPGEVAFAVGDTASDISMLRMARLGLAPAHASPQVGARTRAPYQAGLAQAVARLIGHRPGSCAACRVPRLTGADELVLTLLSVAESGRRGMPVAAARLAFLRASRVTRRGDASPWG
jgi:hypothetical protein